MIVTSIDVLEDGSVQGKWKWDENSKPGNFFASLHLFLIREVWMAEGTKESEAIEALADGYGAGNGTHGDWSGIRDSSHEAQKEMLLHAMNWVSRNSANDLRAWEIMMKVKNRKRE